MDALGSLLDGPRAERAFLLRTVMEPPWSIRVEDRAPVTVVAVLSGEFWAVPAEPSQPSRLVAGDVALLRGPDPYVIADDPGTDPQVVVHPGQLCATLDGRPLVEEMQLGVRTWGNDPNGSTTMLIGTYEQCSATGLRALEALPPAVVLRGADVELPAISLLADEIGRDEPGQQTVLDRLLDLVLVASLRAWYSQPGSATPGWYRAHSDPVVGPALKMMQHHPDQPWTVAELARRVGVSRAGLARRFTDVVGEPPMSFLRSWRLSLAADLLDDPDLSLGHVAREVGYGSPFALSTAFKRHHGSSPTEFRHRRAHDRLGRSHRGDRIVSEVG